MDDKEIRRRQQEQEQEKERYRSKKSPDDESIIDQEKPVKEHRDTNKDNE
jgi:hypothetical protein